MRSPIKDEIYKRWLHTERCGINNFSIYFYDSYLTSAAQADRDVLISLYGKDYFKDLSKIQVELTPITFAYFYEFYIKKVSVELLARVKFIRQYIESTSVMKRLDLIYKGEYACLTS